MAGRLVLALGLCVLFAQAEGSFKFFVLAPNVLYINETANIYIVKNVSEENTTVNVRLENKSDGGSFNSTDHVVKRQPKKVNIRVEEWMVRQPDSEGRLYVRLKVGCMKHGFSKEMDVLVSRRMGIVYLQTDKPIYTPEQTVNVRVFTLDKARYPSDMPVRIDIINPDGVILQREHVHTTLGLVNTTFQISDLPVLGDWSAIVYYGHDFSQERKVVFAVKKYVFPRFDVRLLDVTDYIINSTSRVSAKVKARYSFDAHVHGYAVVSLWMVQNGKSTRVTGLQKHNLRRGEATFSFKTSIITTFLNTSIKQLAQEEARLQVKATVTEQSSGVTEEAFSADCLFSESPYVISTEGVPHSVTPGLPFDFSIEISYHNGKVSPNKDVTAKLGGRTQTKRTDEHGVAYFTFDMGRNVQHSVPLEVDVLDADMIILSTKTLHVLTNNMTDQIKVVQAIRNTEADASGDRSTKLKVQFNGNTGQRLKIYLMLMSGDRLLKVTPDIKHMGMSEVIFMPRIQHRMAPEVRAVVWYIKDSGEVVTHSTLLKVTRICEGETKISPKLKRGIKSKLPGRNVQFEIKGPRESKVALLAVDTSVYFLNNKDRLSRDKMFDGFGSEDLGCGAGGGTTASEVFRLSGVAVLSDASINTSPRTSENCGTTTQQRNRRAIGNQSAAICVAQHCCAEGKSFAVNVNISHSQIDIDDKCRHRMMTRSSCSVTCQQQLYSCCTQELVNRTINLPSSGERTGIDVKIEYPTPINMYKGETDVRSYFPESFLLKTIDMIGSEKTEETVKLPDSVTTWSLQAVSMSASHGMCVSKPDELLVMKDLFLKVHLPYEAVLGEQLELQATVYNTITQSSIDPQIKVKLHTDGLCYMREIEPQLLIRNGQSQIFKWMVVPRRVGEIKLHLTMSSNRNGDSVTRILKVVFPGVQESPRPVCLTLNPQQHIAYSSKDNCVNYTVRTNPAKKKQTFQLHLGAPAEAVDGSHRVVLGVEGGVMAEMVDAYLRGVEHYVKEAVGWGEQTMARLGTSLSAARYIQHSQQGAMSANITDIINKGIQRMMSFRLKSGAFGMDKKDPSLWLTAFAARMLSIAREFSVQMEDDPSRVICGAVQWLMAQNKQNFFDDDHGLPHLGSLKGTDGKLALTAYVLLAVKEAGCIQSQSHEERFQRTLDNLASQVSSISRPYTLALTTYTLAKTSHRDARIANNKLLTFTTLVNGKEPVQRHWELNSSEMTQEDVETTAYGVLAQLALGDVTQSQPYVRWLLTQRRADGLFRTTQTTVVGLQALMEYSINTVRSNVDFTCTVTSRTTMSINETLRISSQSVKRKINVVPAVGGTLDVECQGEGIGQLTLESSYYTNKGGVGTERGFNITAVQNKKMVESCIGAPKEVPGVSNVTVCTRMRRPQDRCGYAIVDVAFGTGYHATTDSLEQVQHRGDVRKVQLFSRAVRFDLANVTHGSELCISFDVTRECTVKNMQPVAVSVYDYDEPDRLKNVIFYHPENEEENLYSNRICVSDACPVCYGYGAHHAAPLDDAGVREREKLNTYVFKGKWSKDSNHVNNAVVFAIKHVGKAGSENARKVKKKSEITFVLPPECSQCRNLHHNGRYLIMGKEKNTAGGDGVQYVLDDESYIIQLDAQRTALTTSQNETWGIQKRFWNRLKTNHG